MASAPSFAATPKSGCLNTATANTARDGTGTIGTVGTIGSSGGILDQIVVKSEDDLADGIVIIWLSFDGGTTWRMFDEFDHGDGPNGSNTVSAYREARSYGGLALAASTVIGASPTVAPTTGDYNIFAFWGDL